MLGKVVVALGCASPTFKVDPANPELIYATTFGGGTWRGYYLPE